MPILLYLGSQCHMTGEIFISLPAFYQSTMILDQQIYQTERIYKICYTPFPEKREVH
mgnify:CR=1 FL=1